MRSGLTGWLVFPTLLCERAISKMSQGITLSQTLRACEQPHNETETATAASPIARAQLLQLLPGNGKHESVILSISKHYTPRKRSGRLQRCAVKWMNSVGRCFAAEVFDASSMESAAPPSECRPSARRRRSRRFSHFCTSAVQPRVVRSSPWFSTCLRRSDSGRRAGHTFQIASKDIPRHALLCRSFCMRICSAASKPSCSLSATPSISGSARLAKETAVTDVRSCHNLLLFCQNTF